MRPLAEQSYYELLEVAVDVAPAQIERAYKIARATWQPASTAAYSIFDDEEAQAILQRVEEAYRVLSDPHRRAAYDEQLLAEAAARVRERSQAALARTADEPPAPRAPQRPKRLVRAEREARGEEAGFPGRPLRTPEPTSEPTPDPIESAPAGPPLRAPDPQPVVDDEPGPSIEVVIEPGPEPVVALDEDAALDPIEPAPLDLAASRPALPRTRRDPLDDSLADGLEPEDGVYDGAVLRRIRMSLGMDLEEIRSQTKVNALYLEAIEDNRYEDLPAPVYVRGFVQEMARCLGLDGRAVARSYLDHMLAVGPGATRSRRG